MSEKQPPEKPGRRLMHWLPAAAAAVALFTTQPASAIVIGILPNIDLPGLGPGFELAAASPNPAAPVNPLVRVGLNPQPLPPSSLEMNLSDPFAPTLTSTGSTSLFNVYFYLRSDFGIVGFTPPTQPVDHLKFVDDLENVFDVGLSFGGNFDPASWVLLNPQPLPPKDFTGFAATFDPPFLSSLTFSLTENGVPLRFREVPEPAVLLLLASGLGALVGCVRRREKIGTATGVH